MQLKQLPGYVPNLNPDEGIWKHLFYTCGRKSQERALMDRERPSASEVTILQAWIGQERVVIGS